MAAKKPQLPIDVIIGGDKHHVIKIDPKFWACLHPDDGRVHIHPGKLRLDGQIEHPFRLEPKPCWICKQPCWTYVSHRANSRAVHDTCEAGMWTNTMPDHLLTQIEFGIAADLGAEILSVTYH